MNKEVGRPSKYKPEYCDMLIEHMHAGFSYEAFAGSIGVCWDTLYEWEKVHPEFSEAKRYGIAKGMMTWEQIGMDGCTGKIQGFNASTWIFNMKNRFRSHWKDRTETEHSGEIKSLTMVEAFKDAMKKNNGSN